MIRLPILAVARAMIAGIAMVAAQSSSAGKVQSWPIRDSVFMLAGPGANTTPDRYPMIDLARGGSMVQKEMTLEQVKAARRSRRGLAQSGQKPR